MNCSECPLPLKQPEQLGTFSVPTGFCAVHGCTTQIVNICFKETFYHCFIISIFVATSQYVVLKAMLKIKYVNILVIILMIYRLHLQGRRNRFRKSASKQVASKHCITRRHIPEDDTLHNHRCDNLKSYICAFACNVYIYKPTHACTVLHLRKSALFIYICVYACMYINL
jgi:hypothetical protein